MPDPSYIIPEHFPRQFSENFGHEIQQTESKFADAGDTEARWTGKEYIFRDLSQNTWSRNDTRGGTTVARESKASFRRTFKKKIEAEAIEIYEWDEELLAQIVHPKSAELQAMRAGYERALDDLFIEACYEDSYGGPEPHITPQAFPAAQKIDVQYGTPAAPASGSDKPMTTWKLFRAKKLFENLNLDLTKERVRLAISPDEEEDLLVEAQAAPNTPWAQMIMSYFTAVSSGNTAAKLLGIFEVIKSTRLPVTGNVRNCVAFLQSGFVKSPSVVKSSMDRVPTDKNKLLLQGSAMCGIARRYDEKFIWIPCKH